MYNHNIAPKRKEKVIRESGHHKEQVRIKRIISKVKWSENKQLSYYNIKNNLSLSVRHMTDAWREIRDNYPDIIGCCKKHKMMTYLLISMDKTKPTNISKPIEVIE